MLIHNNEELVKTIKKILQIFPEGILIQTLDQDSEKLVVQLVNDTAAKEIIEYPNPCGKPINDEKLKYEFKMVNNNKNTSISFDGENEQGTITKLSALLESHVDKTQVSEVEAISSFEF